MLYGNTLTPINIYFCFFNKIGNAMAKIQVIDSQGEMKEHEIEEGLSLMEHLVDQGYDEIQAVCGGGCSCATCHVLITREAGDLGEVEEVERMVMEMTENYDETRSRLSCKIELDESHNGLEVTLVSEGL